MVTDQHLNDPLSMTSPTRKEIEAAKPNNGGWTRAQLEAWGVEWPPTSGWKQRLLDAAGAGLPHGGYSDEELATMGIRIGLPRTNYEINAAKSPRGGFSKLQLACWGISWPPPQGWRDAVLAQAGAADNDGDELDPTPDENECGPIYEHKESDNADWFGGIDAR
jgi:hypothetical protein